MRHLKSISLTAIMAASIIGCCQRPRAQTISITSTNLLTVLEFAGLSERLSVIKLVNVGVPFTLATTDGVNDVALTSNAIFAKSREFASHFAAARSERGERRKKTCKSNEDKTILNTSAIRSSRRQIPA
jgi:hypothetical protein